MWSRSPSGACGSRLAGRGPGLGTFGPGAFLVGARFVPGFATAGLPAAGPGAGVFAAGAFAAGGFAVGFFSEGGLGETGFLPVDGGRFFSGIYKWQQVRCCENIELITQDRAW